jgi:hypothetical protein
MTALPTTPALDAAVAALVARCSVWTPIAEAITAIRLLQFHATLEQLERAPSVTRVQDAPVVFDLDAFRASRVMVQSDDDDEPEAA